MVVTEIIKEVQKIKKPVCLEEDGKIFECCLAFGLES